MVQSWARLPGQGRWQREESTVPLQLTLLVLGQQRAWTRAPGACPSPSLSGQTELRLGSPSALTPHPTSGDDRAPSLECPLPHRKPPSPPPLHPPSCSNPPPARRFPCGSSLISYSGIIYTSWNSIIPSRAGTMLHSSSSPSFPSPPQHQAPCPDRRVLNSY